MKKYSIDFLKGYMEFYKKLQKAITYFKDASNVDDEWIKRYLVGNDFEVGEIIPIEELFENEEDELYADENYGYDKEVTVSMNGYTTKIGVTDNTLKIADLIHHKILESDNELDSIHQKMEIYSFVKGV